MRERGRMRGKVRIMQSEDNCLGNMPPLLRQGIEEFNAGEWFECHETLEELWAGSSGTDRDLYQGILQIAVALHHWRGGNFAGSGHLLRKGGGILGRVAQVCREVDVAALVCDADTFRQALEKLGTDRMKELDRQLIPRIRRIAPPHRETV